MATDFDTARFSYQNYRYCYENGHEQWLVKAQRCFDFWRSIQWEERDLAALRRAARPALTLNVIESLVRVMKGTQRALRNDVRFSPTTLEASASVQAMDAVWMHGQSQNNLDYLEGEVYERGLILGRAYYDIRVDFDDQLQGNASITAPRSQDVVLDPGFLSYDPRTWPQVTTRRWVSRLEIEHLFGKDKAEALRHAAPDWYSADDLMASRELGNMPYYADLTNPDIDSQLIRGYLLLDRQYYTLKMKDVFIDTNTGDTSEIPESWDRDRISHVLSNTPGLGTMRRKVKTVRWTVTCENEVLHEADSPYRDFTIVPFFPTMLDGITIGAVENLIDPQVLYNKVTSQELHIINTTANSGWKSKKGNIKNYTPEQMETVGSRTGLFLEVDDVTQTVKIEPNQVPPAHDRLSMKADSIMRSLSGVSQQARGFAREDVAGEAILMNQAASDINFAGPLDNLHHSRRLLATRFVDCVQAYYTETRVIMINRGSTYRPEYDTVMINQVTPEGAVVNDVTKGKYTTVLVPAPSRTSLSNDEFESLVKLRREVGIQIPDDLMIELAPIANKMQLIQRLKGDSVDAEAQANAQAQRIQQLEEELTMAKARKEDSAAQLNSARAQKAEAESQIDPDAAYERVENNRIATDAQLERERMALEQQNLGLKRRTEDHSTALALTKIDAENLRHQQKLLADAARAAAKPAPTKPTGAANER